MFCPHCGAENSDSASFCSKCGKTFSTEIEPEIKNVPQANNSKNMALALIISFIFTGLGIAYAGDVKRGLIIFVLGIVFNILGLSVSAFFSIISIVIWIYGMYATYKMFKYE